MKINFTGNIKEFLEEAASNNETGFDDAHRDGNQLIIPVGGAREDGYNEITLQYQGETTDIPDEFILHHYDADEDMDENIQYIIEEWMNENYGCVDNHCGSFEIGNGLITQVEDDENYIQISKDEDEIIYVEHQWERYHGMLLSFTLNDLDLQKVHDWNEVEYEVLDYTETSPAGCGNSRDYMISDIGKENLSTRIVDLASHLQS